MKIKKSRENITVPNKTLLAVSISMALLLPLSAHATGYTTTQSGVWEDPLTWGGSSGYPGSSGTGDTASINLNTGAAVTYSNTSITPTISSIFIGGFSYINNVLNFQNGNLTVNSSIQVQPGASGLAGTPNILNVSGGNLHGTAALTVKTNNQQGGQVNVSNGALGTASVTTNINGAIRAQFNVSGTGVTTNTGTFTNNGAISVTGSGQLNSGNLQNSASGQVSVTGGTLTTSGATASNAGSIVVSGGNMSNSGTFSNTATMNVSGGGSLVNSGTLTSSSVLTDGGGGGGSITNSGAINATGGSFGGNSMSYTQNAGGSLGISGATTGNLGATTLTAGTATVSGGSLGLHGATGIVAGASLNVQGGTVTNNSGATITNGGSIGVSSGGLSNVGALVNNATTTVSGAGTLNNTGTITNNGTLNNNAGGTVTQSSGSLTGGTINNAGTFNVTGGSIGAATLNQQAGASLSISTGAGNNVGNFNISGGTTNLTAGSQIVVGNDYNNTDFLVHTGNNFNRLAGVTTDPVGNLGIVGAGNGHQELSVNGGASFSGDGTMNLSGHVNSANSAYFQVSNVGSLGGPAIRGAINTSGVTDTSHLGGSGVVAGGTNYNGSNALALNTTDTTHYGVTFTSSTAYQLSGQSVDVLDNFGAVQKLNITGTAYNYAEAVLRDYSGPGSLSLTSGGTDNPPPNNGSLQNLVYTLNMGNLSQGSGTQISKFDVLNYFSGFTDLLSGSWTNTGAFGFTGTTISNLAGGSNTGLYDVTLNTASAGLKTGQLVLNWHGFNNAFGFTGNNQTITVDLRANVIGTNPIPEPGMLWLFGGAGLGWLASRRKK